MIQNNVLCNRIYLLTTKKFEIMKINKKSKLLKILLKQKRKKDIREKDFSGIDFSFTDFSGTNFSDVDFYRANFTASDFSNTNFYKADFSGANFTRADFNSADFMDVDFENANFTDADFYKANFHKANFTNINLLNVRLSENDFIKYYKVVSGLYKYPSFFIKTEKGHKLVRLGCFIRTMEEWENDFWNNEEEFQNDFSAKSEDRLFAFEVAKLWFIKIYEREMKK